MTSDFFFLTIHISIQSLKEVFSFVSHIGQCLNAIALQYQTTWNLIQRKIEYIHLPANLLGTPC